jgi:hypothetical protein
MAEKQPYSDEEKGYHPEFNGNAPPQDEDVGEVIVTRRPPIFEKMNHFLSRLGGEERGIERILPHEKTDQVGPNLMIIFCAELIG